MKSRTKSEGTYWQRPRTFDLSSVYLFAEFETFHTAVQQAAKKAAQQSDAQDAISNISRVANTAADDIKRAFSHEGDKDPFA
jgi:hypothetical protein